MYEIRQKQTIGCQANKKIQAGAYQIQARADFQAEADYTLLNSVFGKFVHEK